MAAGTILTGCTGAPIESARIVPADPATVGDRIRASMLPLGLTPTTGQDQTIIGTTTHAPADWAACGIVLVGRGGGEHSSRRATSVDARAASVRVALTPAGDGTAVKVRAMFSGAYYNPETAQKFDRPCRSKGVLEARLLAAAE